ncbi:hypothetical protein [Paenibacillus mucilaginosus]|uniref:hypothetical protein n=1 Tax=Paenibacillus mucilaginosus TaxID=61624 RepID=UPI0011807916|nr:hypothetical protein [Paenibacillus mucilaginosus]MCG7215062.1 hypothetical protein [Paenibacillus mucilaginosus]WDM27132.1 hypothetical protein KCX80_32840 [Paenibacillus mucilaginosus]
MKERRRGDARSISSSLYWRMAAATRLERLPSSFQVNIKDKANQEPTEVNQIDSFKWFKEADA